jgi:hypothetical protein
LLADAVVAAKQKDARALVCVTAITAAHVGLPGQLPWRDLR